MRVVHDGVDAVAPAHPVGGPVGAGTPLEIVCVGRLHPQKGQQVLVDALHLGVGGGHDWRVHFWGDALPEHESLAADLRAAVSAAALDDRVVWHGYGADADAMYAGMDVAVVPSTWPEGFSLVTAEAQAAGLPAIATAPGGPADIVDDGRTGRLIAFDDADALCAALIELESADLRAAWGAAGRRRYEELFTTEHSARAVAMALVEVLAGAVAPTARRSA